MSGPKALYDFTSLLESALKVIGHFPFSSPSNPMMSTVLQAIRSMDFVLGFYEWTT
jgi:hypothetical protein